MNVVSGGEREQKALQDSNEAKIINIFHQLYYERSHDTWMKTKWKGIPIAKCPFDLWQYQEIVFETRPNVIIETGTWCGGSAIYMLDIMNLCGIERPIVITVDVRKLFDFSQFDGICQIEGNSVNPLIVDDIRLRLDEDSRIMVVLDSNHHKHHVLKELDSYSELVSKGCYLIVEDTNINGHPVERGYGDGPWEALEEWLPRHPEFQHDGFRERFMLTYNPNGYYKRV